MNSLRSHLTFSRSQRDGILSLIAFILVVLSLLLFADFSEEAVLDISSTEVIHIQKKVDSIKALKQQGQLPKSYSFNPNFISEHKAYMLGMSYEEFDRLRHFRAKGHWVNSVNDFRKVTGVSDSLLSEIAPLFKFPAWVANPSPKKRNTYRSGASKPKGEKIDLNTASSEEFQAIYGIGKVLGDRIVAYREKLGGFSSELQLYEVYGLREGVIESLLEEFTLKTPVTFQKMNINTATASDIATIPGISFELAKDIWEFRRLREGISDLSELLKIEGMTEHKLRLIGLYLSTK